jgi:hypothetical protein
MLPNRDPVYVKPKKTRRRKPTVVKPPAGDVASSGGNYGMKKAAPAVKRVLKPIHARQHEARDVKSQKDLSRAPKYIRKLNKKAGGLTVHPGANVHRVAPKGAIPDTSALPPDLAKKALERALRDYHAAKTAKTLAPAVSVLNQTLRPVHAIAGATDAAITGKNPASAAKRGLLHNKGPTFSTVLKHVGAPKVIRTPAGFVLDVALDPTTYITGGTGSAAKKIAISEAKKATASALKSGASRSAANRAGRAAAKSVLEDPKYANKGIQIGVRSNLLNAEAKTSGRATAAISRKAGISKVATKVRESGPVQGVASDIVHDFRPKERTPAQHKVIRRAERQHRATIATAEKRIGRRTEALRKAVRSKQDQRAVIDAIEADTVRDLPDHLRSTAQTIKRDFADTFRAEHGRGISTEKFRAQGPEDAQAYFPHVRRVDLEEGGKGASRAKSVKVTKAKGREIRKPLATLRAEGEHLFSEDLPHVVSSRHLASARRTSLHDFWASVAKTGRPVTGKNLHANLHEEGVYKVTPHGLEEVRLPGTTEHAPDLERIRKILDGKEHGRFVVLNHRVVDDAAKRLVNSPQLERSGIRRGYDKLQGRLKTLYTVPNPSYHARNLLGDSLNAFLGDATPRSFAQALRVLKAQHASNRFESSAKAVTGGKAPSALDLSLRLGKAGHTTLGRELELAHKNGAIGTGLIGRELPDLIGKQGRFTRATQYREDFARLATYLSARKRGLSPSDAADWSLAHHFDYADITPFERTVARRAIPFYTFFARNTRLQATKILTRPGKQATIAKFLDESAQAAGFKSYEDYAGGMKDYKQRGLPIPITIGGKVYDVQFGAPTTDLNQLSTDWKQLAQGIANRATFYKTVAEIAFNYSLFFQGEIQNEQSPRIVAPQEVGALPGFIKKRLGVQKILDKKSGKLVWGWYAKTDYALRALPEGNFLLGQLLPGRGSRNQTAAQARLGWFTGLKVTPHTTDNSKLGDLYEQQHKLTVQAGQLRQAGKWLRKDGIYTPEAIRVLDAQKRLRDQIDAAKKKVGVQPTVRGKRPPLTPAQQVQKEIEDFQKKQADPGAEVRKEIEQFMSGR